ncbi:Hypothetical predicted protein [Marmota monax]|uniref:Uncharacterized protein n=1 Tax=Marmota monax TaxID=9995 RepID=A0A5E4CD64_MARMO|nr:Hypothetical predicted protein [Marmota monax]
MAEEIIEGSYLNGNVPIPVSQLPSSENFKRNVAVISLERFLLKLSFRFIPIVALLDLIQFQSSHAWTADLSHRVLAYLNSRNVAFTIPSLQAAVENHLEQCLYRPQKLLQDLRKTDAQQFRTAMKCLLEDKKDHLDLGDVVIDLGAIREQALQSPGVNRTLFLVTLERCFQVLNSLECVEILGRVLRGSSGRFLQPDITERLPRHLREDTFKNLSAVFRDLYDQTSAHAQRALYSWMTGILQTSANTTGELVLVWVGRRWGVCPPKRHFTSERGARFHCPCGLHHPHRNF